MDSFLYECVSTPKQVDDFLNMDISIESSDAFEHHTRARSNTWPCPRHLDELHITKSGTEKMASEGEYLNNMETIIYKGEVNKQ